MMTDYEKLIRQQNQKTIERLSILKKQCAEHDITLTEFLLDKVHSELEMIRQLKENED